MISDTRKYKVLSIMQRKSPCLKRHPKQRASPKCWRLQATRVVSAIEWLQAKVFLDVLRKATASTSWGFAEKAWKTKKQASRVDTDRAKTLESKGCNTHVHTVETKGLCVEAIFSSFLNFGLTNL